MRGTTMDMRRALCAAGLAAAVALAGLAATPAFADEAAQADGAAAAVEGRDEAARPSDARGVWELVRSDGLALEGVSLAVAEGVPLSVEVAGGGVWVVQGGPSPVADAADAEGEQAADVPAEDGGAEETDGEADAASVRHVAEGVPAAAMRAWALALALEGAELPDGTYDDAAAQAADVAGEEAAGAEGLEGEVAAESDGDGAEGPEANPAVKVTWVVLSPEGSAECAFEVASPAPAEAMGWAAFGDGDGDASPAPDAVAYALGAVGGWYGDTVPSAAWWVRDDLAASYPEELCHSTWYGPDPCMADGGRCADVAAGAVEPAPDGGAPQQAVPEPEPQTQVNPQPQAEAYTPAPEPQPAPQQTHEPAPRPEPQPAPAERQPVWVVDSAAWDEQVWVEDSAAWDEQVWVEDSAAWDEQTVIRDYAVFPYDGYCAYTQEEVTAHAKELALQRLPSNYYAEYEFGTIHHDATGHYETVHHDASGHYETVHHDEVGHWE